MFYVFGNAANFTTTSWQPEPTVRGTWGILSSCIITTSLCILTAIHLNLPGPASKMRHYWRKFVWLLVGLVAPEFIAFTAWYQGIRANDVYKKHNDVPQLSGPTWTIVHGFYAVMGGFVLDLGSSPVKALHKTTRFWSLTSNGVQLMTDLDLTSLGDIRESEISDKSKASGLAKGIVCVQSIWFIIQCALRFAQSKAISLLELNTLGHAMCALIIYVLWWQKPFDVEEPTLIQGNQAVELFSYLRAASDSHIRNLVDDPAEARRTGPERRRWMGRGGKTWLQGDGRFSVTVQYGPEKYNRTPLYLESGAKVPGTDLYFDPRADSPSTEYTFQPIAAAEADQARKSAARLLSKFPHYLGWHTELYVRPGRLSDFPPMMQLNNLKLSERLMTWGILIIAGLSYGGLHALAWNAQFRTHLEQILWQISSVSVMAFGPLGLIAYLGRKFALDISFPKPSLVDRRKNIDSCILAAITFLRFVTVRVIAPILGVLYMLGRTYLVAESYISLFHSPQSIYEVPSSSAYFPHIT